MLLDQVGHGGHAGAIAVLWLGRHHLELVARRVVTLPQAIATRSAGIEKNRDLPYDYMYAPGRRVRVVLSFDRLKQL